MKKNSKLNKMITEKKSRCHNIIHSVIIVWVEIAMTIALENFGINLTEFDAKSKIFSTNYASSS